MPRRYNGPEHESLRAVERCLVLHRGSAGRISVRSTLRAMSVEDISELSAWGAHYVRKLLEKQLPLRGDFAC